MYKVITSLQGAVMGFIGLLSLYISLVLWQARHRRSRWVKVWIGVVAFGTVTMAGVIRWLQTRLPIENKAHIIHDTGEREAYEGVVIEQKIDARHARLTLALRRVRKEGQWHHAIGKVAVSLPSTSLGSMCGYGYGEVLRIEGRIHRISPPRNPYTFDYQRFAAQKGIYHQAFIQQREAVVSCGYEPPSKVMAIAYRIRSFLADSLGAELHDAVVRSALLALVLGIRDEVDQGLTEAWSMAGILHVLAVSGLHVGMLYMLLLWLLGLFGAAGYSRRWVQAGVLISGLWAYAFITALSASVVRAVTMMSLATLARVMGRRYHFWHGLSFTALAGLLYDPLWLSNIGFQLSYLAVIGIKLVYDRGVSILQVKHRLLKRVWQMTAIAVSVQIATLPLSIYYFHYFPTYFLLGNLIAVPAASLLLSLGLLACVLGKVPWAGYVLGKMLSWIGSGVHAYALWIKGLPYAHLGPFWPSLSEVTLGYGLMLGLMAFFVIQKLRYLYLATVCALGVSVSALQRWYHQRHQQVLMVYAIPQQKAIALVDGRGAVILEDGGWDQDSGSYVREVKPSLEAMGVYTTLFLPMGRWVHTVDNIMQYKTWRGLTIILWAGKKVVCLDKDSVLPPHFSAQHEVDVLIVDGYRLSRLKRWLAQIKPAIVVLGCTLTRKQRACLLKELADHSIPCHDSLVHGAFVLHGDAHASEKGGMRR